MCSKRTFIFSLLYLIVKAAPDISSQSPTEAYKETEPHEPLMSGGEQNIQASLDTCTLTINIPSNKDNSQIQGGKVDKDISKHLKVLAEKGEKGVKGDRGERGFDGNDAQKGEKGDRGFNGFNGLHGTPGERGSPGPKGDTGPKGKQGDPAEKGDKGDRGSDGLNGMSGPSGEPGLPGLKGEKGEPGEKCKDPNEKVSPPENASNYIGSATNPAKTCNDIEDDDGNYFINPAEPFMVTCSFTKKQVCLHQKKLSQTDKFSFFGDKFLLSELGFSVKDLYGISLSQLAYLNSWTMGGKQVIKYHCDKTLVYSEYNQEKSLQLLMWNDNLVGGARAPHTPVYYRVKNDQCKESEVGGTANIEISSQTNNRLPVVDFYIRDKNTEAAVSLTLLELCLNFIVD